MAAVACVVFVSTAKAQQPGECVGECDRLLTNVVGISDLVIAVDILLGKKPLSRCGNLDFNRNGRQHRRARRCGEEFAHRLLDPVSA
jgi:hypothetical protein